MEQGYLFMALILLIGLGSAMLFWGMSKKKNENPNKIRVTLFFFCINYFLVSCVKAFLGESESTLVESLWDMDYRTCIHYGIPLCAAGIILPVAMLIILKERAERYIYLFITNIIVGGIMATMICDGLQNGLFCILFVVCAGIAGVMTFVYKGQLVFFERGEYGNGCKMLLGQVGLAVIMLLLYFPIELFVGNLEEFQSSFWEFAGILVIGTLAIGTIVIILSLALLPKGAIRFLSLLLFGVLIMGYLQALLFNGRLAVLDGSEQTWGNVQQIVNSGVWIIVVGFIIFMGYRKRKVEQIYRTICIYICLVQIVSLGYLIITTKFTKESGAAELTIEGALELSDKENVIVFVLDRFESEILETIMETDNAFLEPLSDFTFYDNATSQFSMTKSSIPHMLTGVAWNGDIPENYTKYAYQRSDALSEIAKKGYHMGVYTAIRYYTPLFYEETANYKEHVEKHYSFIKTLSMMYQTSMYKIMPFMIKSKYSYYSTDINNIAQSEEVWDIENDLPFYHNLVQEELAVNVEYDKAFRFYHMMGSHEPYYLSENMEYDKTGRQVTELSQSKASLKIVYEYLRQMKELGIYDDATIIVTADHGQRLEYAALVNGEPTITSRPLLLVKGAGIQQEMMTINNAPVSQENLMPTLLKAMGVDWHKYGKALEEVSVDDKKERTYVDFDLINRYVVQYAINGDAKELSSWSVKKGEPY